MDPDTVRTKMLLTCFRKACLHHYRDALKRVYYLKKAQLQGGFLVVHGVLVLSLLLPKLLVEAATVR